MPKEFKLPFKLPKDFNPGAHPDRPDGRDLKYTPEEVAFGAPEVNWEKGYDVEEALGVTFPTEYQGSSLSCVGQAWQKYAEALNFVETETIVDLSPKFIYGQIYLPQGGSYIRDGAKVVVKQGVSPEELLPSYEYVNLSDGRRHKNPPTEDFMRDISGITDFVREAALTYQALEYRSIGSADWDLLALAIQNNYGGISGATGSNQGWAQETVRPPKQGERQWGHAFYLKGYGQDERGKYVTFINSWSENWGNKGRGKIYLPEYKDHLFGIWTLVDKENVKTVNPKAMKILKRFKDEVIYIVDKGQFALSTGDKLLILKDQNRAGLMALMQQSRKAKSGVKWEDIKDAPQGEF